MLNSHRGHRESRMSSIVLSNHLSMVDNLSSQLVGIGRRLVTQGVRDYHQLPLKGVDADLYSYDR